MVFDGLAAKVTLDSNAGVGRNRAPVLSMGCRPLKRRAEDDREVVLVFQIRDNLHDPFAIRGINRPFACGDLVENNPLRPGARVRKTGLRVFFNVGGLFTGAHSFATVIENIIVNRQLIASGHNLASMLIRSHRQAMTVRCRPVKNIELRLAEMVLYWAIAAESNDIETIVRRGGTRQTRDQETGCKKLGDPQNTLIRTVLPPP